VILEQAAGASALVRRRWLRLSSRPLVSSGMERQLRKSRHFPVVPSMLASNLRSVHWHDRLTELFETFMS